MKKAVNGFMDWFEERFNVIIDLVAFVGASFMILFSLALFVSLLIDQNSLLDIFEVVVPPGLFGFFGILMLFALRITRRLTK